MSEQRPTRPDLGPRPEQIQVGQTIELDKLPGFFDSNQLFIFTVGGEEGSYHFASREGGECLIEEVHREQEAGDEIEKGEWVIKPGAPKGVPPETEITIVDIMDDGLGPIE